VVKRDSGCDSPSIPKKSLVLRPTDKVDRDSCQAPTSTNRKRQENAQKDGGNPGSALKEELTGEAWQSIEGF